MATYTAPAIRLPSPDVRHVELVFRGVEQAGPSFEVRVFLNRVTADESTPQTPDMGYAGSFHVYGYGDVAPPAMADAKGTGSTPVAPIEKRVKADKAALDTAIRDSGDLAVTVVTVPVDPSGRAPQRPFEELVAVFDPASSGG